MSENSKSWRVAIVGATGVAGQQFVDALRDHPSFTITVLAASKRSAGKTYIEALRRDGHLGWYADHPLDDDIASMTVLDAAAVDASQVDLVFSCVESDAARELEAMYARTTPVISTASAFRYEDDVPVLIPAVNMDHAELLRHQMKARGWGGFVAPNPNCTTVGLAITLAPLHKKFGVARAHVVSMQSVSGAGRSPGVVALDVVDNIIPYIPKEEAKVAQETRKILGQLSGDSIEPADIPISATCTRVGVIEGHTEAVHVELAKDVTEDEVVSAWREFGAEFVAQGYPSAPRDLIEVHTADPYRPQVRLDRDSGDGMTTVVGRLRRDPAVERGFQYVLVSHNTKMGAAKGCLLVAEHLAASGWLKK